MRVLGCEFKDAAPITRQDDLILRKLVFAEIIVVNFLFALLKGCCHEVGSSSITVSLVLIASECRLVLLPFRKSFSFSFFFFIDLKKYY